MTEGYVAFAWVFGCGFAAGVVVAGTVRVVRGRR